MGQQGRQLILTLVTSVGCLPLIFSLRQPRRSASASINILTCNNCIIKVFTTILFHYAQSEAWERANLVCGAALGSTQKRPNTTTIKLTTTPGAVNVFRKKPWRSGIVPTTTLLWKLLVWWHQEPCPRWFGRGSSGLGRRRGCCCWSFGTSRLDSVDGYIDLV